VQLGILFSFLADASTPWLQTDTGLFTSCDQTYFYFFQTQAHTNHKGTKLQSHTRHVANKYKPLFFANWHAMLQTTKEPSCNHTQCYLVVVTIAILEL
jgi:hypothetical protein